MNIELIKATASYHRAIAGLFWVIEDYITDVDNPFNRDAHTLRLAIRRIIVTEKELNNAR